MSAAAVSVGAGASVSGSATASVGASNSVSGSALGASVGASVPAQQAPRTRSRPRRLSRTDLAGASNSARTPHRARTPPGSTRSQTSVDPADVSNLMSGSAGYLDLGFRGRVDLLALSRGRTTARPESDTRLEARSSDAPFASKPSVGAASPIRCLKVVELGHRCALVSDAPVGALSAVVLELERDGLVQLAEAGDDSLEIVAALAGDAHRVALDLRLDLRKLVADQLRDPLRDPSGRPRRSPIRWRTLFPPASSTLPQSKILSERPRRIALDSIRSFTAPARYSSSVSSDELRLRLGQARPSRP